MMKKREFQIDDEQVDKDIEDFLTVYTVPKVDDEKIDETIEVLKSYMPTKRNNYSVRKLICNEITYINKYYFLFSVLLMIAGIIVSKNINISSYEAMLYISPVPIFIGTYMVMRCGFEKMWKLEKSFKYSYSKVVLSRILIVLIFSAVIDSVLCVYMQCIDNTNSMIHLMSSWIIPSCILFSLNLLIMKKVSSFYSIAITSVIWLITVLILGRKIAILIIHSNVIILSVILIVAVIFAAIFIKDFCSSSSKYEGEILWN